MDTIDTKVEEFDNLLEQVKQARETFNWNELHCKVKQLQRVSFHIYMLTDEGE